jgi:hypothetical protein
MSSRDLRDEGNVSILIHRSAESGERSLHPSGALEFAAGDKLVLCVTPDFREPLNRLNRA